MDVNGTRFHLLLGRRDWERRAESPDGKKLVEAFVQSEEGGDAGFSWDYRRDELTLGKRAFYFLPPAGDRSADISARRGAAADACGNVYWIGESGTEIFVRSIGSGATTTFWPIASPCNRIDPIAPPTFTALEAAPPKPLSLSGLVVTTQHMLVAGTLDPAGLLIFDLCHGGDPRQLAWPSNVGFTPFDLAAAQDGGVWILDRLRKRVWRLDRTFGVLALGAAAPAAPAELFQPVGGASPPAPRRQAVTLSMSLLITANDPVAIEALPDDSILILDSPAGADFSEVRRIRNSLDAGHDSTSKATTVVDPAKVAAFRLRGHDFVFSGEKLLVAGSDGDQAIAFNLILTDTTLKLEAVADFYPLRLFGAKALIAAPGGAMYDAQDRWVPLVAQKRPLFAAAAKLLIRRLDGKDPDCVWHRLMIDGCIPPECDVVVRSRAGNDPAKLDFVPWSDEPRLFRRPNGSEIPFSAASTAETWELLFQRAKGHYLDLCLELRGTTRSTPRLHALRVWYPRFSYLDHYLPAVYREDPDSASFLDRFLANIEGFMTNIEDRIAAAQTLLDVRSAPAETLEWLASWFAVALDPAWDEPKRRLFLRHAAEFFEWRGTTPGLLMALRLVTAECADESIFTIDMPRRSSVRVVEKFRSRSIPAVIFGDTSEGPGLPLRRQKARWEPSLGAVELHRRWAEATGVSGARYPIAPPDRHDDSQQYVAWATFSRQHLGFVPRAGAEDLALWRDTLQRRYPSIDRFRRAWNVTAEDWDDVPLPAEIPTRDGALRDWIQFEGFVLPARDAAHRFTVFLPQATLGLTDRERQIDLARRVVALEKPAHTTFDLKFYWAFFRVGEARLGDSTIVDLGSRSPELLSPFILDRNYLGSGFLAPERCGCPPSTRGGSE